MYSGSVSEKSGKTEGKSFFRELEHQFANFIFKKSSIFKISKAWKIGVTDVNLLLLKIIRMALFWRHCFSKVGWKDAAPYRKSIEKVRMY